MPLDNVGGDQSAYETLPPLIVKSLQARGWTVASGVEVETLLEQRRVRYFDSLDGEVRRELLTRYNASQILTVTVYAYAPIRNASIGLAAQLVDATGAPQWSSVAGLTSGDTERALGLGKKESLEAMAPQAIAALLRGFPCGSCTMVHGSAPRAGLMRRALSFRDSELDHARRICILPFDNESTAPDAVRLVAGILSLRLSAAGFQLVDPSTLRAAALNAHVSFHNVGSQDLRKLEKAVGTSLFLRGTIYGFDDPAIHNGTTPALDLEATLVDVAAGKVLWAVQDNRKGTDYIGFLMLGAVSNSVTLTDRVAAEMIATARINHEKNSPSNDRPPVASLVRKRRQPDAGEGQR